MKYPKNRVLWTLKRFFYMLLWAGIATNTLAQTGQSIIYSGLSTNPQLHPNGYYYKNGTHYLVWSNGFLGTFDATVKLSTSTDGRNWTTTTILTTPIGSLSHVLTVDNNNKIHIAYVEGTGTNASPVFATSNLVYANNVSGSWVKQNNLGTGNGTIYNASSPQALFFGMDGKLRLYYSDDVWYAYGAPLHMRILDNGTWSNRITISNANDGGVDSRNNIWSFSKTVAGQIKVFLSAGYPCTWGNCAPFYHNKMKIFTENPDFSYSQTDSIPNTRWYYEGGGKTVSIDSNGRTIRVDNAVFLTLPANESISSCVIDSQGKYLIINNGWSRVYDLATGAVIFNKTDSHIIPAVGFQIILDASVNPRVVYANLPCDTFSVQLIASASRLCHTDTVTLKANTVEQNLRFQWSKDGIALSNQIADSLRIAQTGTYTVKISRINSCDTTISRTFNLENPQSQQSFNIVQGDSLRVNDTTLRTAGTYRQVIHRQNACDSIVITVLNVINPCAPLPSGAVARYDFDGNAQDLSGNAYHATSNSATLTMDRFGRPNRAYHLNGINQDIKLNYNFGPYQSLTLSAWVKVSSYRIDTMQAIVSSNESGQLTHFQMYNGPNSGAATGAYVDNGHLGMSPPSHTPLNQWRHVVQVISSGNSKVYVDGVLTASSAQTYTNITATNLLKIGSGFQNGRFLNGDIDDILMYNRALTEAEIVNLYGHSPNPERTVDTTILAGTNYVFNNHIYNEGGTYRDTIPNPVGCDSVIITNLSLRPQPCAPIPTNGLVLAGGFNGNANDESGNGNHGTVNGATLTADRFGKPNRAYLFNGIDNNINIPNSLSLQTCVNESTMSVWFTGSAWYGGAWLSLLNQSGQYQVQIFKTNVGISVSAHATEIPLSVSNLNLNQWYHLVVTHKNGVLKVYLNGIFVGSARANPRNGTTDSLHIGYDPEGATEYHTGKIDDILIYNRALSHAEIVNLYGHAAPIEVRQDLTICTGKSVTVGRHTYTMTGVYTDTLQTIVNQCDSVVTTHLTVTPPSVSTQSLRILEGQSVTIHGRILTQAGTYRDTFWVDRCKQIDVTILSVVQPCASGLSTTGLIAYYPFNGNARDMSGYEHHGTVVGATPAKDRLGNLNGAYWFNGTSNYMQIPNYLLPNNAITYCVWVKPDSNIQNTGSIISKHDDPSNVEVLFRIKPDKKYDVEWTIGRNYYNFSSNQRNLPTGTPTGLVRPTFSDFDLIVFSYDGAKGRFWKNGLLILETPSGFMSGTIASNLYPMTFGKEAAATFTQFFKGTIDDIAIYNRALTTTEIQQLYQNRLITWTKDTTICAGKSLVVNEHRYDSTGIYRDTFRTVQYGCDSVIQITNLTVPPRPTYDRYYSLLEGGSLQLGNRTIRVAGIYPDTIRVTGGCDTIRRNIVAVLDPCASNMPTNGLIIYEDCGGNANDRSGYGNHGTVHGATLTTDRYGNPNKAYYFNGINNYIEIANATPLSGFNDLTLSAWVYKTSGQTDSDLTGIVTKWYQLGATAETRNQDTWAMYAKNDKTFCYTSNSVTGGLAANLAAERWVHIVFIHKSNVGGAIYIDGNLAATNAFTGRIAASLNPVLIGADRNGVNIWRHFKGKIDEIAVYNRALDTTEIRQLYNNARPVESTQNATICSGQSVTVGDTTYRTTGNYRKIIKTVQYQCDSVVNTNLIVTPPIRFEQYFTIRPGQSITVNGHIISQASVYQDAFRTAAGCDSIVKTTVAMLDHCANELNTNDLIFYMPADGNANDLSGNGNHGTVTNAVLTKDRFNHPNRAYQFTNSSISCPVDRLFSVRKELTLSAWIAVEGAGDNNPRIIAVSADRHHYEMMLETTSNNRQLTFVNRDSHAFRSTRRIPTDSNWYHVAMTFKNGLIKSYINGAYDNQATLNFSEIAPFTQALLQIGYSDNGLDRFNGKIDDLFIFKRALADSEITALYQMYPVIQRRKDTTVCGGQSIWVGNRRHDTTGSYVDTLQTVEHQCDSVVTTRLTVLPIRRDTLRNIAFCEGDSVIINGVTIKSGGVTHQTLPAYDGCDSFLTIYARVKPKKTFTARHQMCQGQSYIWGGRTLTQQDIYTHPFRTFEDCDSLGTLNLIVIPPVYKTRYDTICEGQSITIGSNSYNQTGTFTQTLPSFQQCDSILTTHLTVHPVMRRSYDAPICAGDSVWTGRRWLKTAGTSSDTFRTWRGCDSIVTITVIVKPILRVTQSPILCSGRGITVGDSTYYVSGTYTNTLQSVQYQCDSIVTTILTIVPPIRHIVRQTICANESFQINDSTYRIAGLYQDTIWHLRGENLCDTALEIQLTVLPLRFGQQRLPLCQDDSLRLHDRTITQPGTYRDTLPKIRFGLPCDSVVETVVYPLRKDSTYEFFTSCHARDVGLVIDSSTLNPAGCKRYIFKRTTLDPTDVVTISGNEGFCEGRFTTLSVPSGFRYAWSTGVPSDTFRQIQAHRTGDYTVTITNNFGCKSTATKYVFTNPLPQAAIVGTSAFCANNQQVLTAVARFCRFQWSTGATTDTIQPNRTDTYTVIATDLNGCKDTATHFVRVHPLPNFKIDGKPYFCEGTQTDLTVAAVNPTPPLVQYLWSTNAITPKIKVFQSGDYWVTVTSDSNCSVTKQLFVKEYITDRPADIRYDSICHGESYLLPSGRLVTTTGFHRDTIKWAGVECDKIIRVYRIVVRDSVINTTTTSLCDPDLDTKPDTSRYNTNAGCTGYRVKSNVFKLDSCFYVFPIHGGLIPNDNGENDYFRIPHIQFLKPNQLIITDIRGVIVYQMNDYDNKWSGTDMQGNPLLEGEYYYWFKLNTKEKVYKRTGLIKINYVK